jgi:3-dehydroquinate synthase
MKRTTVKAGNKSYPVIVHDDLLEVGQVPDRLLGDGGRCIVITDETVARLHQVPVEARLVDMGFTPTVLAIKPGESNKNSRQLLDLAREMVLKGARRATPVFALGGGVVGDLAGMVASLYMRGVPFVQIPTTLLAQVDSSIGGKTGIDLPEGKNLLGTFWQPEAVWSWVGFLKTLAPRQIREGLSESLKYGYILKPELLDKTTSIDPQTPLDAGKNITELVHLCAESKAEVVAQDVSDNGRRQILNFGHTIGHAIEAIAEYKQITHGEAVAIGMTYECLIAEALGVASAGLASDMRRRLSTLGLPTTLPQGVTFEAIVDASKRDKKRTNDQIKFALVSHPGQCSLHEIEPTKLLKILHSVG